MYQRIPTSKIIKIKELSKRGLSDEQIADIFEFAPKTVKQILGKNEKPKEEPEDKELYAHTNPRCAKCKYRMNMGGSGESQCCFYIVRTGKRRGCPVKGCNKYVKGNPQRDIPMTGVY